MEFEEMFDGLSSEQREKFLACKDIDEMVAYAKSAHIALPDELLSSVAGGSVNPDDPAFYICPRCGYDNFCDVERTFLTHTNKLVCKNCGQWWSPHN